MDIPPLVNKFHLLKHTEAYIFNQGINELMAEGWKLLFIDTTVHVCEDGQHACVFLATLVKFTAVA